MLRTIILLTVWFHLLYLSRCVMGFEGYSLGVHLGQRYITAAYINGNDEAVPLVKLFAPPAYQYYMQQLHEGCRESRFHKSAHTPDDATMIGNLLQDVKDQATQLLDYPVNITAISLPRDIGLGPHRDLTATIIASNATAVRYEWELREFLHTARLAYGLDTCRALGISEAADCDLMDETAVILFVDYGLDGRLNLYAGLVGETDVDTDDSELYQRGRHGEFVVAVMAGGKEEDDEGAQKDAVEDLRRILDGFIQEQILGPGDAQYLRAIIISGDASEAAIDTLKQALQLAIPEDWRPLVRDQVDPFWVGAVGAARRAKMHIVDPRYNITAFEEWLQDLARMHDEL